MAKPGWVTKPWKQNPWFESVAVAQQRARKRLPANGKTGVEDVFDILRGGIDSALLGMGVASIDELTPDLLEIPAGFHRALGIPGPVPLP